MRAMAASVARGESAASYAESIGCGKGVTGFVYHTVPVALHVWLRRQSDYRGALIEAVRLGGDTDTVAAVVGALVGTRVGREGIPAEWLRDLWEWPRTPAWMESSAGGSREAATRKRARASCRSTGSSSCCGTCSSSRSCWRTASGGSCRRIELNLHGIRRIAGRGA